jgi:TPR repeat protein
MNNVGRYYQNGTGVIQDLNKAREWFTKSAAQGYTNAQTQLDKLNAQ